ncbi:MAG TPA: hypothetical protein PK777_05295, partial [Thermoguttaceae bacterium]|nr:hypothetical protein [Thermoguttaceae bacterium]
LPGQGGVFGPAEGIPQGQGYLPSSEILAPPLPGEKTQVAQKAGFQSRRSIELWVGVCLVLLLLAGGLLYLLQRIRSEGPEVVLGKSSSPNQSTSGEKLSSPPNGQNPSGVLPGSGLPKEKQSQEKTSPKSPSQEKPKTPSEKQQPSPSQKSEGPSGTSEPKGPGEKSSPPVGPSENNGPGMSAKPPSGPEEKTSPPPPPKPSIDPAKQSAWQKAVEDVRSALAEHDLASAEASLKTAEANAQTPEQHDVVERLRMLRHYLEEFWKGIRQSVVSLEAAQEFSVGKLRFAIVEGNSQYLVVRAEGRNIRWPIEKIPGSVVEILAKRWFRTNDPATNLAYGAYYAVRGDTQQARQYWQQAGKGGVDVSGLLEELRCWPLPEQPPSSSKSPLQ